MRPKVARLCALDNWDPDEAHLLENPVARATDLLDVLGEEAAAPGMHFIVDDETQEIHQPTWLFLKAMFGRTGVVTERDPVPSFSNSKRTAYNLVEWLNFLKALKRHWTKADHRTLGSYALFQVSRVSPRTSKQRDGDTVRNKLGTVYAFYRYTNAAKLTTVTWDHATISAEAGLKRAKRRKEDERVRPFSKPDLNTVRTELGPKPSELGDGDLRPTRDRLLLEVARRTGMRGEEICYLEVARIKHLKPDPTRPNAMLPVSILITKGRKRRTVGFPNSLVHELQLYIRGERERAMTARKSPDHGYVFVNSESSSRPGRQLKTNTIHRLFAATMRRVGLATEHTRRRKGVERKVWVPDHTFHDLRHTFAVRYYLALRKVVAKDPGALNHAEPWELVQIALGHDDWETTRKIYLSHAGVIESEIGDRVHDWVEEE